MEYADDPITSVIVVENLSRLPTGYRALTVSIDEGKSGNLWTESMFERARRTLCYTKSTSASQDGTIVAEIAVTREGESPPPGFTQIELTTDTRQKALKKNNLYVKLAKPENLSSAVLELMLISKEKKPRPGYAFAGEVNGFQVCYRAAPFRTNAQSTRAQSFVSPNNYFTALPPGPQTASSHASVPAAFAYGGQGTAVGAAPVNGYGYAPSTMQRQDSHSTSSYTPLSGVPFTLNERFSSALRSTRSVLSSNVDESFTTIKTAAELEREFDYPFSLERSALADLNDSNRD